MCDLSVSCVLCPECVYPIEGLVDLLPECACCLSDPRDLLAVCVCVCNPRAECVCNPRDLLAECVCDPRDLLPECVCDLLGECVVNIPRLSKWSKWYMY